MKARSLVFALWALAGCDTAPAPTRRPPEIPRDEYVAPSVPEVPTSSAASGTPVQEASPPPKSSGERAKPPPPPAKKKKR